MWLTCWRSFQLDSKIGADLQFQQGWLVHVSFQWFQSVSPWRDTERLKQGALKSSFFFYGKTMFLKWILWSNKSFLKSCLGWAKLKKNIHPRCLGFNWLRVTSLSREKFGDLLPPMLGSCVQNRQRSVLSVEKITHCWHRIYRLFIVFDSFLSSLCNVITSAKYSISGIGIDHKWMRNGTIMNKRNL